MQKLFYVPELGKKSSLALSIPSLPFVFCSTAPLLLSPLFPLLTLSTYASGETQTLLPLSHSCPSPDTKHRG